MAITFLFAIGVAVCNFFLNLLSRRAANSKQTYFEALTSPDFIMAFLVGVASILFMLKLYSLKEINLSQAILLMGSLSILLGSIVGHFIFQQKLSMYDWLLFILIFMWYVGRLLKIWKY